MEAINLLFLDDATRCEGFGAFESAGWVVVRAPYGANPPDLSEIDLSVIAVHHTGCEAALTSAQAVRNGRADLPLLFQIDEDAQETIEQFSGFALAQIVSASAGAAFQLAGARAALRQAETQRAIAQHAAHWQKALEGSQQGVWNWNAQTNQTYFSPQWKAMLGYGEDEIQNQLSEWETRVHPDDLPAAQAAIQLHLDGQVDYYENEHRLRCKDGSYKWILDSGKVVERSPDGAALHLAGTHHDITALKQAELERARLATRFQTLYRQSPIGIEIYDANGRLVEQNAVCLEIFGVVDPSELPGFQLFDDPNIPTTARQALHGGATVSYQAPFDFEQVKKLNLYHTTRSGQIWLEIVLSALKEEDGHISGYMAQVVDISERKQIEAQMLREGRHYARLMQTSRDAIHVLDIDGRLVEWNDAFLNHLGVSADEAALLNVADWDATWRGDELFAVLRGLIQNSKTFETRHRRKDGTILDVEITAAGFEQDGQAFLYASARDITERKRAEETLRASEERYRLLFENMQEGFSLHEIIQNETGQAVDFRFLDANSAYEKHTQQKPAEVIGRRMLEIMPNADPAQIERYGKVALSGEPMTFEYYSQTFARHLRVRSFSPKHGQFACLFEDISAVHEAEKSLRDSEERNRIVFNNQMYAISIVDPATRQILDVNPTFVELYGYSREEILAGMRTDDFNVDPVASSRAISSLMDNNEPVHTPVRLHRKKDGTIFSVEIKADACVWQGRRVLLAVAHDISERIKAEARLSESEERFRLLFEYSQAILLMIDAFSGVILGANPAAAEFYGFTVEQLCKMNIAEINILPPEVVAAERVQAAQRTKQVFLFKHRLANQEVRTVEVHSTPITIGERKVLFSIIHDVTQREEMQAALRENEERLRALFDAHDAPMLELDPQNWIILGANCAAENFYGYPHNSMKGMAISEINPLPYAYTSHILSQVIGQQFSGPIHTIHRLADGSERTVEIFASPIELRSQTIVFEIIHDITEREQIQVALHESEERFHGMFLNHSAVMLQIDPGNWAILDANHAAAAFYGYSRLELLCMNVSKISSLPAERLAKLGNDIIEGNIDGFIRTTHHLSSGEERQVEVYPSAIQVLGNPVIFAIVHDVTEREQMQAALRASEERFRALYDQTNDAVFFIDLEGNHKSANLRAAEMLGYTFEEVQKLSVRETSAELQPSLHIFERLSAGEKIPIYERLFRKKNGEIFPVEINVELVKDANGNPIHYQSVVRDISRRKADEQALQLAHKQLNIHMAEVERLQIELREQAIHDHLTGLYNRRYLDEMLSREMERAGRDDNPLCIIIADIDHFKRVNDTFGHLTGDRFLIEFTQLIQHCMRGSDLVFRYGGEEFLLMLPGTTLAAAEKRADEIREKCAQFCLPQDGKTISTTISMGIAAFPEHSQETEGLIMQADRALYRSKQAGRNCVTVWSEAILLSAMG